MNQYFQYYMKFSLDVGNDSKQQIFNVCKMLQV